MKYEYFIRKNNNPYEKVTLTELRNELNKICVTTTYWGHIGIDSTDLKKVEKVIRLIRKGTYYNILSDEGSFSCYAKRAVTNNGKMFK